MTGWHKLAFGSVTDKVVRASHLPVLVLRAEHAGKSHSAAQSSAAVVSH